MAWCYGFGARCRLAALRVRVPKGRTQHLHWSSARSALAGATSADSTPGPPFWLPASAMSAPDLCRESEGSRGPKSARDEPIGAGRSGNRLYSGRPAPRLWERLGIKASRQTILRRHPTPCGPPKELPVRVLGVDEGAWRKHQKYGTMLLDLEPKRLVDLLPVRSASSLADWLREHPGAQVIARCRAAPKSVLAHFGWKPTGRGFSTVAPRREILAARESANRSRAVPGRGLVTDGQRSECPFSIKVPASTRVLLGRLGCRREGGRAGFRPAHADSGKTRAFRSSNPARLYLCRLPIFSRLICPSHGPLLHGAVIASSTARRSRRRVRPNCTISGKPELIAVPIHSPQRTDRRHLSITRNCRASFRTWYAFGQNRRKLSRQLR